MPTASLQAVPTKSLKQREHSCCGVIEQAAETAREKRYNRTKPQPWIVRKLMVAVTAGIMGYAAYVYIQRLCLPMIRKGRRAQAGRSTGIALLVVFCVLYLWMVWAYLRVVLTPPGYARDYIARSERPLIPAAVPLRESWNSTEMPERVDTSNALPPDVEMDHRNSQQSRRPSLTATTSRGHTSQRRDFSGLAGPSYEDLLRRDDTRQSELQEPNARVMNTISAPKPAFVNDAKTKGNPTLVSPAPTERRLEELNIVRRPPTTAVLHPVHRYCSIDQILKPYRAHHCRVCGTCVLKYDHHCPWIGQCVGARNHKFFLNFSQATTVFAAYVFGTLLAYTIKANNSATMDIDPQEIIIIAMTGFFLLFTTTLVISHVNLILRGQTTVESMQIHSMKEREADTLARGFKWWEFGAKRRKEREWDKEWGALNSEGNIWWRGNTHEEWTDVMGKWWLGWIFPVGRSDNDGLSYPVNPRFDSEGRWRKRAEWPEDLR
ncbi:DHHC palmitoyltransferase-domain-containing protein [Flammula alnicola]|nr:DHHC palmitoyltransferase-domain-containing protein [Flammula alnicola]